jgi:hypothetical protein
MESLDSFSENFLGALRDFVVMGGPKTRPENRSLKIELNTKLNLSWIKHFSCRPQCFK